MCIRDRVYCVEDPGYKKISQIYECNNAKCLPVQMDEQGISVELIKKANAQIAHISPTHHFPTGITMPVNRRYELLAWANESSDRYIIEDDYDSEFRMNGHPIPPILSICLLYTSSSARAFSLSDELRQQSERL